MKLSPAALFFIFVATCIILGSLTLSCNVVVPYDNQTQYAKFEGMSNYAEDSKVDVHAGQISGFDGVYESPLVNNPIDTFADNKGDNKCIRTGYSNQDGFLCLTPDQIKLLQHRGGNA